jgi:hypothetical protein
MTTPPIFGSRHIAPNIALPRNVFPRPLLFFCRSLSMRTFQIAIDYELSIEERGDLERRLERKLGPVHCVRHPAAIDDVRIDADDRAAVVTISACCELSERRARTLVSDLFKLVQNERRLSRARA